MGDTISIISGLIAVKKEIIGWYLEFKMLKLIIKSSEKKTVELNNKLVRLPDFLCYK